jgi:precorrin-2 dehydrogenase/sirohydrochlorin ferrochelatase
MSNPAALTEASASSTPVYPPIVKGTSLMIAYRLLNRPVLLIGGGNVASGRLFFLLEAGAHVTLVAPSPLDPSIQHRLGTNAADITYHDRTYLGRSDPIKVEDFAMVLTAIDDNALSYEVYEMCKEKRVVVNVADVPPKCDFYFGAQLRRGPLQVMVSTGGQGPKVGAMVRDIIVEALPDDVEEAIEGVGKLRADLRKRAPGVGGELGKRRMEWMIGVCDKWGLGEMGVLKDDEALRARVLDEGWDKEAVLGPEDVGVKRTGGRRTPPSAGWERWIEGKAGLLGGAVLGAAVGSIATLAWVRSHR